MISTLSKQGGRRYPQMGMSALGQPGRLLSVGVTTVVLPSGPPPYPSFPIGAGGGTARYFTPLSARKKKRIEEVIAKETRLVKQFAQYQEKGADADLINALLLQIRELQLLILRFALESEAAQNYIAQQREQEELDDIKFILTVI